MTQRTNVGEYIRVLRTSVPEMFAQIKELAAAEIKPMVKHGGFGAGGIIAALIFAVVLFEVALLAAGFGLSIIFAEVLDRHPITALALGFTVLAVIFLILTLIIALIGWRQLKKVRTPQATIAETKASISAITMAIESGIDNVENHRTPADGLEVASLGTLSTDRDAGWTH
ncbi:hypothetical protein HMPREF1531_01286 [Propionibacterium sp. oral taxon 192 str. F0372]|uniref:phage holin family protein n=1 Tax=Propionibacterium sp. oral taxon 192 TaxID=671222 RepID=UPI000352E3CD|nr:phage holin family protein [Propionibacterium sp. oral taxon 192]EPH03228.1 hypothetical protein HMPREF1531_01286 [Propionibacterium sp. oral taxon 192 str. F0372]